MTEGPTETTGAGHEGPGDGSAGAKDADQLAVDRAATLDRIAEDLGAVEAAMRRLDEGTYGRCDVCGEEIPEAQVASDPLATRCEQHGTAPARVMESERSVAVLASDDALSLRSEHPEG